MNNNKKITGKIVNYNSSFVGNIYFDKNIVKIEKSRSLQYDKIIIPGFVDLHCHVGGGFDVMEGADSILGMSKYHLMPNNLNFTYNMDKYI